MKKFIIFCLPILVIAANAYAAIVADISNSSAQVTDKNQTIAIAKKIKLVPKKENEKNKVQYSTINVTYPQIEDRNLSPNEQLFNKAIGDLINQEVQQFKRYVAADMPHMKTLPEEVRKNTLFIDYDYDVVKLNDKVFINVRLAIEGFQAGRAHPYHKHRILNFDLVAGKALELQELFKPDSKYLDAIADYCRKKLDEKLEDKTFVENGTKPIAKNFQNWNLENDGILFTFDEYQVAPYVFGAQEVHIPFEILKTDISSESVIYPCVQHPEVCAGSELIEHNK